MEEWICLVVELIIRFLFNNNGLIEIPKVAIFYFDNTRFITRSQIKTQAVAEIEPKGHDGSAKTRANGNN